MAELPSPSDDLVQVVLDRARLAGESTAFVFVDGDGQERSLSNAELDRRSRALAARIQARAGAGDRVLVLCAPGLDYIVAFFGCLYAGTIAVPAYPPTGQRGLERLLRIAQDCSPRLGVGDRLALSTFDPATLPPGPLRELDWLAVEEAAGEPPEQGWRPVPAEQRPIAFLQYTSGSTGEPKGVVLSHANICHNARSLSAKLGLGDGDVGLSWLPPYHDMGLIGGILQPLHTGFPCVLMSPLTFAQHPAAWLEAAGRHRATITAAPNFGYDECVRRIPEELLAELRLDSLRYALVGAEPIRPDTLERFASRFAGSGFAGTAFHPCYGLAEATLYVTGAEPGTAPRLGAGGLVSCGSGAGGDEVIVVDPQTRQPCPAGVVGEIWIAGPTVAAGYWANPEATERTFGARLADTGAAADGRSYLRSGDLGVQVGGELFITGRIKDLIVVRGRNHYPQDLEYTAEQAWPGLAANRQAAFGVDTADGEQVVLVAETTPALPPDTDAAIQAIRQAVMSGHGVQVADVVLVRRGSVPRTTSGKIRRRACRDRYLAGELKVRAALLERPLASVTGPTPGSQTAGLEAAGSATGAAESDTLAAAGLATELLDRIAAVLNLPADRLLPDVPLVAQGIDSLRAAELDAVLRDGYGIAGTLDQLLDDRPLSELVAELAGELANQASAPAAAGEPADVPAGHESGGGSPAGGSPATDYPASPAQERMWILNRVGAGSAYHIAGGLRFLGPVDLAALRQALGQVLRRHPALRTTFSSTTEPAAGAATLRCHVQPWTRPELELVDVSGEPDPEAALARHGAALVEQPFDLDRQWPVRVALLRLSAAEHALLMVFHHIAVDGASIRTISAELEAGYEAAVTGGSGTAGGSDVPARVAPTAPVDQATTERDARFWSEALREVPDLELATDRPRGPVPSFAGGWLPLSLPAELTERVRALAEECHATPFMVLLGAYATLLAGYSGQRRLVVGSPVTRRGRATDRTVGYQIDTLPIPQRVPGEQTFRQVLAGVRQQCLAGYRHSGVPFERIVAERAEASGGRPDALIRALLAFDTETVGPWNQRGIIATPFELPVAGAQCDLAVYLSADGRGGCTGHLSYATALFEPQTARRLAAGLVEVLRWVTEQPDQPVSAARLQPEEERRLVLDSFSGAGVPPLAGSTVALFEEQVDRTPDAIAISFGDQRLSYRQLDEQANRLAWRLRESGVGPERLVGLLLQRSQRLPVALLAILKAGGCCLALDPSYPARRLGEICAGARPLVVITEAATAALLEPVPGEPALDPASRLLNLDRPADVEVADADADGRPAVPVLAQQPAFAVYTSGSTGRPKGVVNTHAGLANRLLWARANLVQQPGDPVLHKTPIGFDVAIGELLWPLVSGLRLVIARAGGHQEPDYLARLITEAGIRVCHFVPTMLRLFLADPAAAGCRHTLHRVLCSGEELVPELVAEFSRQLPGVELHNLYGPAEAAIEVSAARVDSGADGQPAEATSGHTSIGRPLPGVRLYVLDAAAAATPIGVPGELHIGGIALARGYLGQPGLTAERFVPDPFGDSGRLYRTGDQARWRPDGSLEFLGRTDNQLKIRGQRVEPADIEASLTSHPAVSAAAVRAEEDQRLLAYLVCTEPVPTPAELREHLARRLPRYMVPADFVLLPELPIGPNGKVAYRQLSAAGRLPMSAGAGYQPAGNPVEQAIADIWGALLGVGRVGVHDDFYALGGHSLLAIRIITRVREVFGVELDVADLLLHRPTVAGLAEVVLQRQLAQASDDALARALARVSAMSDAEAAAAIARGWSDDGAP
jgi:amino acid adenylation domain-containing protein